MCKSNSKKTLCCGTRGLYICLTVTGAILGVIGIILLAVGIGKAEDCSSSRKGGFMPVCDGIDTAHQRDWGSGMCEGGCVRDGDPKQTQRDWRGWMEHCCTGGEVCMCSERDGGWITAIVGGVLIAVGFLVGIIFMCGIFPCLCFAKDAPADSFPQTVPPSSTAAEPIVQAQQVELALAPAPAPAAPPAAAADTNTKASKIKELHELKTSGVLTEEEFNSEKAKILAES